MAAWNLDRRFRAFWRVKRSGTRACSRKSFHRLDNGRDPDSDLRSGTCLATSRFGLRAGGRRDFPAGMNRADLMALDKTTLADLVLRQAERIPPPEARLAETGRRFEELERRVARGAAPFARPEGK